MGNARSGEKLVSDKCESLLRGLVPAEHRAGTCAVDATVLPGPAHSELGLLVHLDDVVAVANLEILLGAEGCLLVEDDVFILFEKQSLSVLGSFHCKLMKLGKTTLVFS